MRKVMARKHGYGRTYGRPKLYSIWKAMRQRCMNTASKHYRNYGARGIKICERWNKFENFLADMGNPPPGLTLDRINNDGNYEPTNCRWATQLVQSHNSRAVRIITVRGESLPMPVWAKRLGMPVTAIRARLFCGWSEERAVTEPRNKL